ncbi:MAG: chromosomal replication initiator protein DnaA [Gemmataceae bacterium]
MTTRTRDAAAVLADAIARRIGEPRYQLWFARHTRFEPQGDWLKVGVPNRHFQEWLDRTFGDAVRAAAAEVFGQPLPVRFVIDAELFQAARREQAEVEGTPTPDRPRPDREGGRAAAAPSAPDALPNGRASERRPEKRGRRWHKLGDFVVGPCNRVAHASALSVAEAPGESANPLVLYGPVGTGKTHLLEGIYAAVRRAHPDWRVTYLTSEEFTNRFLQAMRHDRLGGFRRQLRDCDVLLIDDLHFLATKKATQEEFLHTFDALVADGRQVVVTCDCHPRLADDLSPELTDRLLGGAVWSLQPPDADTRLDILRAKSAGVPFPDDVLKFLASQLRGNVRELEGAVQSVRHFSRVTGRPIDVALVREALAELLRHAIRVVRLDDIDQAVCSVLRLEPGLLQKQARAWVVSHPRMVAMFLARKHTASSYADIGKHFGGRNHSTVVAAEKKVRAWMAENAELSLGERRVRVRELVERVERDLGR